jgi:O-antigen/teichoic acid export membrane protein
MDEVSAYGAVYRITRVLNVAVTRPFMFAWPTLMWSVEKRPEAPALFARTLTYLLLTATTVALWLSLFAHELVHLAASERYVHAAGALPWISFGIVFFAMQSVLNTGASLTGRTETITAAVALAVPVNAGLNLLLIPRFGLHGAAVATFFSYASLAALTFGFSHKLRPMPFEWKRIGTIAAVAFSTLGLGWLALRLPAGPSLTVRLSLAVALPLGAGSLVLNGAERAALRAFLRSRLARTRFGITRDRSSKR